MLAGNTEAIHEIAFIGQENIPPEVIIEAFKNGCEEIIYNLAEKKVKYKNLYFKLCKAHSEDRIQGEER